MKTRSGKSGFLLAAVIAGSGLASCQIENVTSMTSTPTPGSGHDYIHMLSETVSPANGAVSVRIGVQVPPGRKMSLPFGFAYNTNGVYTTRDSVLDPKPDFVQRIDRPAGLTSRGGWEYMLPKLSSVGKSQTIPDGNGTPFNCLYGTDYVFTASSGSRHALHLGFNPAFPDNFPCNSLRAQDQGGDVFVKAVLVPGADGANGGLGARIADVSGTVYNFTSPSVWDGALPASVEDSNGNRVAITANASGVFSVTDTAGRTELSSSGFGTSADSISVSGVSVPYIVKWGACRQSSVCGGGATMAECTVAA